MILMTPIFAPPPLTFLGGLKGDLLDCRLHVDGLHNFLGSSREDSQIKKDAEAAALWPKETRGNAN